MKKFATMAICFVLIACMVAGGSLAYLTDRDSEANVFTVGDVRIELSEDFAQGEKLTPGVKINKDVQIKNTGINDAYVWYEYAIPTALDNAAGAADKNIIHVNHAGANWLGYQDDSKYWEDGQNAATPENECWIIDNLVVREAKIVDGKELKQGDAGYDEAISYNVYVVKYNGILPVGKTTSVGMTQVYMDTAIDIDTEGNWYKVVAGNVTDLNWNTNEEGAPIIYVSAYGIQADGFEDVVDNGTVIKKGVQVAYEAYNGQWADKGTEWATPGDITKVATAAELQNALDNAEDGDVILLTDDITGYVTATQKADVKVTINGDGHKFAGAITVDGKSATYTTAGLTIQNVNFEADSISADACINLGEKNNNNTRYTCNVTVKDCTFDVPGAVGVKSYTGGDKNLTISGCTATDKAHSLVQAKGIDGVLVEDCTVNSKNGLNFNNSDNVTVDGCTVDVKGYAVRFGESSGGVGAAETYLIKNCTLKSANDDGDATIILRGTADNSTLTIENTTITGTPDITNTATGATVVK